MKTEEERRTCRDCRFCGQEMNPGRILCKHPSWTHWPDNDSDRHIEIEFAPDCACFEPKEKP
jgi:hypothetical protein